MEELLERKIELCLREGGCAVGLKRRKTRKVECGSVIEVGEEESV